MVSRQGPRPGRHSVHCPAQAAGARLQAVGGWVRRRQPREQRVAQRQASMQCRQAGERAAAEVHVQEGRGEALPVPGAVGKTNQGLTERQSTPWGWQRLAMCKFLVMPRPGWGGECNSQAGRQASSSGRRCSMRTLHQGLAQCHSRPGIGRLCCAVQRAGRRGCPQRQPGQASGAQGKQAAPCLANSLCYPTLKPSAIETSR